MKVCVICGSEFKRSSNRQKYCKECRQTVDKDKKRRHMEKRKERYNELVMMRMERYRERWQIIKQYRYEAIGQAYREHGNIMNQYHCGKGTGSLGPHPNNNEAKERELIEKEMRRLKILTVSNTEL